MARRVLFYENKEYERDDSEVMLPLNHDLQPDSQAWKWTRPRSSVSTLSEISTGMLRADCHINDVLMSLSYINQI